MPIKPKVHSGDAERMRRDVKTIVEIIFEHLEESGKICTKDK